MTGAIVLAAGAATRMGRQKMLLPFAGSTVVAHVVAQIRAAGIESGIVVTGADADAVAAAVARTHFAIARNPDYSRGMLSSVRTGLAAASETWGAALLALGDQPLITPETVRAVISAHGDTPDRIVVPAFRGRRGHPIVLPRAFWDEAMTRHDDVGLRGVLHAHGDRVREVSIDSHDVLSDLDTPEDYARALQRLDERR